MIKEVAAAGEAAAAAEHVLLQRKPLSVAGKKILLLALSPRHKGLSALNSAAKLAKALVQLCLGTGQSPEVPMPKSTWTVCATRLLNGS